MIIEYSRKDVIFVIIVTNYSYEKCLELHPI